MLPTMFASAGGYATDSTDGDGCSHATRTPADVSSRQAGACDERYYHAQSTLDHMPSKVTHR
jgi:hypothetical protein